MAYNLALEQLRAVAMDLPANERLHYPEVVMEAMEDPNKEGALLYNLYKEIDKVNDVDFGRIPDSKGDITKYAYYDHLMKCIEALSSFEGADSLPNISRMNKLHNILLQYREDFVFIYKRDIEELKIWYVTLVIQLNAIIELAMSDYVKYLKLDFNDRNNGKFNRKESILIGQIDTLIKLFENGNWSYLMRGARKVSATQTQQALAASESVGVANEAIKLDLGTIKDVIDAASGKIEKSRGKAANFVLDNGTPAGSNAPKNPIKFIIDLIKESPTPIKIASTLIAGFLAIRGSMFFFGRLGGKISNFARNQSALLKAAIDADRSGGTKGVKAQQMMIKALDGIADLIDARYKKAEVKASKDIAESNQATMGAKQITANVPTSTGVDFGL